MSAFIQEPIRIIQAKNPFPAPQALVLSIIIPAYNEASSITTILDKIAEVDLIRGMHKEIIVVNDCSTDATDALIKSYLFAHPEVDIQYFVHDTNQGKGAAIQTGIQHAGGDFLLIQDADLEYDPADYNVLLIPALKGDADVVYGSRFMGGHPHRILFFWHSIGNRVLTFLSNMFNNLNLTDVETGYKLFRTSLIQQIPLQEKRFGFEPEITAKIAHVAGVKIYEVGIAYYGRTYKEGKKIKWRDGVRTVFCILKYSLLSNIPKVQLTVSSRLSPTNS
jgi:glycosyltransferase involved in cell wall biosynthesis